MSDSGRSRTSDWLSRADRSMDWSGVAATVLGLGVAGFAAADALLRVGARVTVVDRSTGDAAKERAQALVTMGLGSSWGRPQSPRPRWIC